MSKLAILINSVGVQDQKAKNNSKIGLKPSKLAYFDLILPLEIWTPTEFDHLAHFDITYGHIDGKCWN